MKKNKVDRSGRRGAGVSYPLAIGAMVMVMILFPYSAASGQGIQAQDQPAGGAVQVGGSPPVQPAQQGGQYQQAGDQPIDAQEFGEDGSLGTIPPSAAIPDADWVFEVPVDIQGISEEIGFILILTSVKTNEVNEVRGSSVLGTSRKIVELEDGAYQGRVLVGVNKFNNVTNAEASQADYAYTRLWLCSDIDCQTYCQPTTNPNTIPAFCRVNPERPFRRISTVEFNQ